MRRKELTTAVPEFGKDGAVQVEVTLPVRQRRPKGSPDARVAPATRSPAPPRIPRITRLLALAIKFQDMVDRGEVCDYADLARLGYVTRARLTQIMNLLLLAPDIQADIVDWSAHAEEVPEIAERHLRRLTQIPAWEPQRRLWRELLTAPITQG
jgi:hypothetical protein